MVEASTLIHFLLQELDAEGRNPLHTAACHGQKETIRYLISPTAGGGGGVDPMQKTTYGTTAYDEAHQRNLSEITSILKQSFT